MLTLRAWSVLRVRGVPASCTEVRVAVASDDAPSLLPPRTVAVANHVAELAAQCFVSLASPPLRLSVDAPHLHGSATLPLALLRRMGSVSVTRALEVDSDPAVFVDVSLDVYATSSCSLDDDTLSELLDPTQLRYDWLVSM